MAAFLKEFCQNDRDGFLGPPCGSLYPSDCLNIFFENCGARPSQPLHYKLLSSNDDFASMIGKLKLASYNPNSVAQRQVQKSPS
jgi:hypothetical protein